MQDQQQQQNLQAPPPPYSYPPPPPQQDHDGAWTTGLCDCCKHPANCCITFWCPCVTFGRNAEIIDRGRPSCIVSCIVFYVIAQMGCACIYSHIYRNKLRGMYSLQEKPCLDCCVHCWCGYCALCQEHNELTNRGWKPSKGWEGQDPTMKLVPPHVATGMAR